VTRWSDLTPEQKEKAKVRQKRYETSPKGQAKYVRYRQTAGYQEAQKRHRAHRKAERVASPATVRAADAEVRSQLKGRDPHYFRRHRLKKQYGLSLDDYRDMLVGQAGRCLICLLVLPEHPHIDHDHATGKVRGLLCGSCNRMLGQANDSILRLRAAIRYLGAA